MTDEEIKILITNHLSGQSSPEESRQLLILVSQNKNVEKLYKELQLAWTVSAADYFRKNEAEELRSLHSRMTIRKTSFIKRKQAWITAVAASLLLLFGGNAYLWFARNSLLQEFANSDTPYIISAPTASRTMITLPDGTHVTLNAGSKLSYLHNFGAKDRRIELTGEAIFDVAKDAGKPFIVNAGEMTVNVLGTKFDITAYPEEDITVSLFRGKVRLNTQHGTSLTLLPNEQAHFNRKTGTLNKCTFTQGDIPQWTDGDLRFNQVPFSQIARMLERRFNVSIRINDNQLANERFAGSFSQEEGLNDILNDINMEGLYKWTIENGVVTIERK